MSVPTLNLPKVGSSLMKNVLEKKANEPKRQIVVNILSKDGDVDPANYKVHKFSRKESKTDDEPTFDGVIVFKNSLIEGKTHTQLYFEKDWTPIDGDEDGEITIGEEQLDQNAFFNFKVDETLDQQLMDVDAERREKEISLAANAISMINDSTRTGYYNAGPKLTLQEGEGQTTYGPDIHKGPETFLLGGSNRSKSKKCHLAKSVKRRTKRFLRKTKLP